MLPTSPPNCDLSILEAAPTSVKITEADDNSAERGEVMAAVKVADLISAIDSIFPLQIFFDNYIVFANGSINGGKVFS